MGATGSIGRLVVAEAIRQGHAVRGALMTATGVTNRNGACNRSTEAHDWKAGVQRHVEQCYGQDF